MRIFKDFTSSPHNPKRLLNYQFLINHMKCAKTLKKDAEKLKQKLIKAKALSRDYKAHIGKTHIYFPLSKEIKGLDIINSIQNL